MPADVNHRNNRNTVFEGKFNEPTPVAKSNFVPVFVGPKGFAVSTGKNHDFAAGLKERVGIVVGGANNAHSGCDSSEHGRADNGVMPQSMHDVLLAPVEIPMGTNAHSFEEANPRVVITHDQSGAEGNFV